MTTEVFAIIGIFFDPAVMIILIVWFTRNERVKRYQLQADLYVKALEKGQSVPADLFEEPEKRKENTSLKAGIICMTTGIGIALAVWIMVLIIRSFSDIPEAPLIIFTVIGSMGVIPFMIGVAFLIIHFAERKKEAIRDSLRNAQ